MELHCEALRGSPPIFYQFYHENVILGSSSAPSAGGASFNFSVTAEHSGNYFCEASNGQGAQRSEVVTLNLTGIVLALGLSGSVTLPQHPGTASEFSRGCVVRGGASVINSGDEHERGGASVHVAGKGGEHEGEAWRTEEFECLSSFISVRSKGTLDKQGHPPP